MAKNKTFLRDGHDWHWSLNKLTGRRVVDVTGYPSDPFGGTALFKVVSIVFEDGTEIHVEGEHDTPYIPSADDIPNLDEKTLQGFIDADRIEDEEEE